MALIDTYNFNPLSTTDITDELHSDLGSSDYQLGVAARGFKGGSDFVIKNVGYQEISNTGALGSFTGSTVAGLATHADWELDVTVDSVLYQLDDIDINIADDWDTVAAAIQTSLQTATSGNETCEIISGKIRIESVDSYGVGSSILIEAGSAGTGSGDLIAAITALSADYTATIDTAVDGEILTEDTDYELSVIDQKRSTETAKYTTQFNIYTRVKILNADYQDTDLYISYKIVLSYPDAEYFNHQDARIEQNETDISSIDILWGYINGLEISNAADADHDVTIQPGQCANSDNDEYINLASAITKQIDASWAEGNNAGGLFSGASLSADTFYYLYVIVKDSDGTVDAGFDDNQIGTNVPAGWSSYRRIRGAVLTDGSLNILGFRQDDNEFKYVDRITNVNDSSPGTSRKTATMSVPPNMTGKFSCFFSNSAAAYILIQEIAETDTAPTASLHDLRVTTDGTKNNTEITRQVNSSSLLAYRSNVGTVTNFVITTISFYDNA